MPTDAISMREAARRLGVSPEAISKAVKAGRIPRRPDGKLSWGDTEVAWRQTRQPQRASANGDGAAYFAARTAREISAARKADLEYRKMAGELTDTGAVRRDLFGMGRRVRDRLLGAAARLAPVVAGLDDRRACYRAIEDEMLAACNELGQPEVSSDSAAKPKPKRRARRTARGTATRAPAKRQRVGRR